MVKRHLKRINSPKTWPITRKETIFVIRPQPSGHTMANSVPISILLKEVMNIASTTRAVRFLLQMQEMLVNGRKMRKPEETAGFMDVVAFPAMKTSFRILLNDQNKLAVIPIAGEEAKLIPSKVTSKRPQKGAKLQLGFHNGRTLLTDKKEFKTGDTLMLTFDNNVEAHYPLAAGAFILVTAGKHVGSTGVLESLADSKVKIKSDGVEIVTAKRYAFVLGNNKPAIKLKS